METVAVFVDVQNIYYTTRQVHGRNFDYGAFWKRATAGREVVAARAYAIDRGDAQQRRFQGVLRSIGFEVKLKPFIQRRDGSAKGDWDVGITLDVMDLAPACDVVVLATGDGDFDLLAGRLTADLGRRIEVYGVAELTAASLKRAATRFVPIDGELLMNGRGTA